MRPETPCSSSLIPQKAVSGKPRVALLPALSRLRGHDQHTRGCRRPFARVLGPGEVRGAPCAQCVQNTFDSPHVPETLSGAWGEAFRSMGRVITRPSEATSRMRTASMRPLGRVLGSHTTTQARGSSSCGHQQQQ